MRLLGDESLQEFLVKIGWNLDELGYNKASDLIDSLFENMLSGAGAVTNTILKGSSIVLEAIKGITEATVGLISKTAQLDKETEKWARRYWTTEQNARSLQSAMQAMGLNSLDDLYYSTYEEYSRFLDLRKLGQSLEAPKELDNFLLKVRDIQHEFNRLKVVLQYGTRWVVYYLGKMFGTDAEGMLKKFRSWVNWLAENIPRVAKVIATALSHVINIVMALYTAGKNIYNFISDFLDMLPQKTKTVLLALSSMILLFLTGPVGLVIAGISFLLLLLEDYYVWTKGGKSLFDYSKIHDFFNSDEMEAFKGNIAIILEGLAGIWDILKDFFTIGVPTFFKDLNDILASICGWLEKILGYANELSGKTGNVEQDSWIGKGIAAANAAREENDVWNGNNNPLLQPPTINNLKPNIVDNSNIEVNVGVTYNKESDTFEIAKDIIRNTNYSLPVSTR